MEVRLVMRTQTLVMVDNMVRLLLCWFDLLFVIEKLRINRGEKGS
jgi:hypothetical protein